MTKLEFKTDKNGQVFCPYCGSGLIIRAWRFYLVIPYYIHLWKCARPNGITVKFGVFYIV